MSYPTIILGAEASHDFINPINTILDNKTRPPLTKNLCNLSLPTPIIIVSGSNKGAMDVKNKLQIIKTLKFEPHHHCFSNFVRSDEYVKNFLKVNEIILKNLAKI